MNRSLSGAADLIDGHGRDCVWQSSLDRCLTGRILAAAALKNLAHDDIGDLVGRKVHAFQAGGDHTGTQIRGGHGG
jgi:hypothetical protein